MTTRPLTYNDDGIVELGNGVSQWGADYQPFAQSGVHIQYRRETRGLFVLSISCEAVLEPTGELIARADHSAITYDLVRKYLAR